MHHAGNLSTRQTQITSEVGENVFSMHTPLLSPVFLPPHSPTRRGAPHQQNTLYQWFTFLHKSSLRSWLLSCRTHEQFQLGDARIELRTLDRFVEPKYYSSIPVLCTVRQFLNLTCFKSLSRSQLSCYFCCAAFAPVYLRLFETLAWHEDCACFSSVPSHVASWLHGYALWFASSIEETMQSIFVSRYSLVLNRIFSESVQEWCI